MPDFATAALLRRIEGALKSVPLLYGVDLLELGTGCGLGAKLQALVVAVFVSRQCAEENYHKTFDNIFRFPNFFILIKLEHR